MPQGHICDPSCDFQPYTLFRLPVLLVNNSIKEAQHITTQEYITKILCPKIVLHSASEIEM